MTFTHKKSEQAHRVLSSELVERVASLVFARAINKTESSHTKTAEKRSKLPLPSGKKNDKDTDQMSLARDAILEVMTTVLSVISTKSFDDIVAPFYVFLQQHANEPESAEMIISMMRQLYLPVDPTHIEKGKQFITTCMGNFSRKHSNEFSLSITKMIGEILLLQAKRFDNSPGLESWRQFVSDLAQQQNSSLMKKFKDHIVCFSFSSHLYCSNSRLALSRDGSRCFMLWCSDRRC